MQASNACPPSSPAPNAVPPCAVPTCLPDRALPFPLSPQDLTPTVSLGEGSLHTVFIGSLPTATPECTTQHRSPSERHSHESSPLQRAPPLSARPHASLLGESSPHYLLIRVIKSRLEGRLHCLLIAGLTLHELGEGAGRRKLRVRTSTYPLSCTTPGARQHPHLNHHPSCQAGHDPGIQLVSAPAYLIMWEHPIRSPLPGISPLQTQTPCPCLPTHPPTCPRTPCRPESQAGQAHNVVPAPQPYLSCYPPTHPASRRVNTVARWHGAHHVVHSPGRPESRAGRPQTHALSRRRARCRGGWHAHRTQPQTKRRG